MMDYYCYWKIGQYWGSFTIEGFGKVVVIKDPISFLFKAFIGCNFIVTIEIKDHLVVAIRLTVSNHYWSSVKVIDH